MFSMFKLFHNEIINQFGCSIKNIRSNNALEYMQSIFEEYCDSYGIIYQATCAHTPQQTGVAERKNCHLLDVARLIMNICMFFKYFWSDALLTACYLINRVPSSVLHSQTPFSTLYKDKTMFEFTLRVFGCLCFVHVLGTGHDKLDPRAIKCLSWIFSHTKGLSVLESSN